MASSPRFKVYDADNQYIAATKGPEAAAAIIAGIGGIGWTIRDGHSIHNICWKEGSEEVEAGESYDIVARAVYSRIINNRAVR
jgi:hypothetical protein